MNKRVKELRKSLGLTMEKFGKRLGVTKVAISNIEKGNRNITEQMFKSICREFNVNEEWLRTGKGDMHIGLNNDDALIQWANSIFKEQTSSFRKSFVAAMSAWTDDDWAWIEQQARTIIDTSESKKFNLYENAPATAEELERLCPPIEPEEINKKTS